MTLTELHNEHFTSRLEKSKLKTDLIVAICKKNGHFKTVRKSTKEEDLRGIDYWVTFQNSNVEVPIQFKLRPKLKYRDLPVSRYQPWHGYQHEKTKDGRDYRGIEQRQSVWYYVGLADQVYRVPCEVVYPQLMALSEAWNSVKTCKPVFAPSFFTAKVTKIWAESDDWSFKNKMVFDNEYGQVWWKKNYKESPKFNMYLPYALKEWFADFSSDELKLIKKLEDKLKKK